MSQDYAKSAASNMFWFIYEDSDKKDTLKGSERKIGDLVKRIIGYLDYNEGYLQRWIQTKESKQISLFLPLNRLFGFCKDINRVFRGLLHEIELERNLDHNMIHRAGVGSYKFEISHLS